HRPTRVGITHIVPPSPWVRTLRHDPGLATSPPVRDILGVATSGLPPCFAHLRGRTSGSQGWAKLPLTIHFDFLDQIDVSKTGMRARGVARFIVLDDGRADDRRGR